jgi:hypothetical protein
VNWLSDNRHWLLFAGAVLSGLGTAGAAILGFVATVSTLFTGGSLVATFAPFLLGALLLGGLTVVFTVALLVTLAKRASSAASDASFPTSQRAATVFHALESVVPGLAGFGLGDRFEPSVEERRAALTERYVAGDITESELEAELATVLDEEDRRVTDGIGGPTATLELDMADDDVEPTDREIETET